MSKRPRHPIFARFYVRVSPALEREGGADHRDRLLAGLSGRVIEVGAGHGLNFAHYPPEVTGVLAVEPEPYLREAAQHDAGSMSVSIEVVDGMADALPAGDETFDAAVASLVLCSVPDQRAALREIRRVLRPGGELRFFEHVKADSRSLQRKSGRRAKATIAIDCSPPSNSLCSSRSRAVATVHGPARGAHRQPTRASELRRHQSYLWLQFSCYAQPRVRAADPAGRGAEPGDGCVQRRRTDDRRHW